MSFAAPPAPMPPTSLADVDAAIDALHEKRDAWRAVSLEERAALLDRCVAATAEVAEKWAAIGASIKGIAPSEVLAKPIRLAQLLAVVRRFCLPLAVGARA